MIERYNEILENGNKRQFPATDEALSEAIAFTEEILENAGCSMKNQMSITVAFEEVFVNIAHYAYGDSEGTLDINVAVGELSDGSSAVICFRDHGVPFDPLAKQDPDITESVERRKIGGLGIFMVKKLMDDVFYRYENGENVLVFTKSL